MRIGPGRIGEILKQGTLNFSTSITSFDMIEVLFRSVGVKQIFVKNPLAEKQDNEKNQIVLRSAGSTSIANLFPAKLELRSPSKSEKKRHSNPGIPKIGMNLDFRWLHAKGTSSVAPDAKIIVYPQYPEARFSGFLAACQSPPDALRRDNQAKYGKRILILGANDDGVTFGLVVTELEDAVVSVFPDLPKFEPIPILQTHEIGTPVGSSLLGLLLSELKSISGKWHPSISLRPGDTTPIPFKGNQGAGFTLEALLNVPRNADKAPDKHGFELKSFKPSGKISLMTPTADLGPEGEQSFRDFMAVYGWLGARGDGRQVFNGTFRYRKPNKRRDGHHYMLDIHGYPLSDVEQDIYVMLSNADSDELVSGWSMKKLLDSWNKKHAAACYVEYERRNYTGGLPGHDAEYRFTGRLLVCHGTSIWRYLSAIADNYVYYDPGHEITAKGAATVRPQWRVSVTKKIGETLGALYDDVSEEQII